MKVGDKVKILIGEHEFEGRTGVIYEEFEKDEYCDYDFHVNVEGTNLRRKIPFYSNELEVIND